MENALARTQGLSPTCIYDLKGSKQGRFVDTKKEKKKEMVLKDVNWERSGLRLRLPDFIYRQVAESLRRDVELLQSMNICDYSLLIGMHKQQGASHGYFWCSIIDTLQLFNMKKRSERFVKKSVLGQKDVSCEDTMTYAKRFLDFALLKVFQPVDVHATYDIGLQGFEGFV